jgi:hypothetical protein
MHSQRLKPLSPRASAAASIAFAVLFLCDASACQCLTPVSEDGGVTLEGGGVQDAGTLVDAGTLTDAGRDAGAQCQTALDCPAPGPLPFCGAARSACVNGFCLIECGGTCLASGLLTQVPRAIISCPACTFMAEGCE